MTETTEFVKIPKTQYNILKKVYDLNKKQQDMIRMYEVEENIKNGRFKSQKIDDFIDSI